MNESEYHNRIILTTKYGRQDKTKEIEHISYAQYKNVYWITFKDGKKYPFKGDDVEILKNTLREKVPSSVFQFLLRMAEFSELKNDDDENLLIQNKSVLVVSNNNAATANVAEKLASPKYGMDFICATLGKFENMDSFLKGQKEDYPAYIEDWGNIKPLFSTAVSNSSDSSS